jgi:RNA recognition motif-containing protein
MKLWIENLPAEASDEDLSAFLQKYGLPPCTSVVRVQGNGSRPGALVSFSGVELDALYEAAFRLDGLYWKSKALAVQVFLR